MRVGVSVYCTTCRQEKQPRGRSAPLGMTLCSYGCSGYSQAPLAGDLWPGETEAEFGFPVSADGVIDKYPEAA